MTVEAGFQDVATRLYSEDQQDAPPVTQMGVGTGTTAAQETDQSLESEVLRKPVRVSLSGKTVLFSITLEEDEGNGQVEGETQSTISEVALFAGDTMVARHVYPAQEHEVKDNTKRLQIEGQVTFAS